MEKVYLQLYSLGQEMQNLPNALKKISEIGYTGVEFASSFYGDLDSAELKKMLDEFGLTALSAHVSLDKVNADVELVSALGAQYMICPMATANNRSEALSLAEKLNEAGELCKKYGMKYGYHNHTQEFAEYDGEYLLDILIKNTDPSLVVFQLDVGWATTAGINAVDYINKQAGRFEMIHAKETGKVMGVQPPFDFSKIQLDENGRPVFTPEMLKHFDDMQRTNVAQGKGLVDWKAVKSAAEAQGTKAFIVEREFDYLGDIFAAVKEDLAYMRTV